MNESTLLLVLLGFTLALYLVSFVYVVGIVWRVELELDLSYKFFSIAVLFFFLAELFDALPRANHFLHFPVILQGTRFLAALMLFLGMYAMRDLIRKMDGEK